MNTAAKQYVPLWRALPTVAIPIVTFTAVVVITMFAHAQRIGTPELRGAYAGAVQFLSGYVTARIQLRMIGDRYRRGRWAPQSPLAMGAAMGALAWGLCTFAL